MKKTLDLLIFLLLLIPVVTRCQPYGELSERKQNFDFDWKFATGDHPDAETVNFSDTSWRSLDLPHDWSIEGQISLHNPTGNDGGYFPAGIGWYRKTFEVPAAWKKRKTGIYFEGVYMNSEVFINGKSLGVHPYGYTSFYYDLTPYLQFGADNVIAVRVDNSQQKNCRWYSGSGIYRHVWLMVNSPVHIDHWGVAISTPEVSKESATVRVKTVLKNETDRQQTIQLRTELTDKNAKSVGNDVLSVELAPISQKEVIQNIVVSNPSLWTPDTPQLHTARSIVRQGEESIDVVSNAFGIRSIRYSAENGFELNGSSIKLNGGCVHHDNGCLGAAAYDRAEERKAELLQAAGFNAVRTSHNPPSESFLDACDRLGLLVIDESFDGWREEKTPFDYAGILDEWWQRDLESLVLRDRNHPSVVMWSSGNEIIERTKPEAVETARMLNSYIRELDPTRPVTSAMTSWNEGWEIFDSLMAEHDVCGYNYMLHEAESDHKRVPSRIIFQSESYPKDAFYCWNMVQDHNYIIGDFVWTAMDYLGESGIGRYYYPGEPDGQHWERDFYPWHGAYCGDIDLIGRRKPISHYRSLLWNNSEKLFMAVREPNPDNGLIKTTMWAVWPTWESWNWPGREGKDVEVEVYSKYPKVRLYLNGKLVGEQPTDQDHEYKAMFTLPYAPGTIVAVGVENDKEMESTTLKTAGKPAQIKLFADRDTLQANGQDLSFVTVEITDPEGNIVPNAENNLSFALDGAGFIAGAGNANLQDATPYAGNTHKVWKGRALIVVKSSRKPGELNLKVSSPELPDVSLVIHSVGE